MLLVGVAAGCVWERLASPAEWEVTRTSLSMGEAASEGQFAVIVVFVVVGIVASLLLGGVLAWSLRDMGWVTTPLVVLATAGASVIAWRVGVHLGPPDPSSVKDVAVGDHVPARLAIDGLAPFLAWPVFGLVGLIGTTLIVTTRDELARTY